MTLPPSISLGKAQATRECRGNAAGGVLSSSPTDNPRRCARCNHAYTSDGTALEIHWSSRAQQWLCFVCNFKPTHVRPAT